MSGHQFTPYLACMLCEGFEAPEYPEQVLDAWQYPIDTGLVRVLQGFYGRTAARLIDAGYCRAGGAP